VKVHFEPEQGDPNLPVKTIIHEPDTTKDQEFALVLEKGMKYETVSFIHNAKTYTMPE
jgi:hypothetical protein